MSPPQVPEHLTDEHLREAFGTAIRGDGPDAATTEAIWRAVSGACSPAELQALLEQVRACPELAEAWRMARAIHAEVVPSQAPAPASTPTVGHVVRGPATWWRQPAVVGAGAVMLMAAVALLVVQPGPVQNRGPGPMRADTIDLATTLDETPLQRDAAVLRWTAAPEGTVYGVTITTDALEPVARVGGLHAPEWQIPPESLAAVPAGTVLLWRVEAQLPDGTRQRSPTFEAVLP